MNNTLAAMLVTVLALISVAGCAADARPGEDKAHASKPAQTSKPDKLFADTKKYLAQNADRTAATIKRNAATLAKRVSPGPKAQRDAKKAQPKSAAKDPKAQPPKPAE